MSRAQAERLQLLRYFKDASFASACLSGSEYAYEKGVTEVEEKQRAQSHKVFPAHHIISASERVEVNLTSIHR